MESVVDDDEVEMTAELSPSFVVSSTHLHSFDSWLQLPLLLTAHALTSPFAVGLRTVVPVDTWVASKMTSHTPEIESGTSRGVNQQMD